VIAFASGFVVGGALCIAVGYLLDGIIHNIERGDAD